MIKMCPLKMVPWALAGMALALNLVLAAPARADGFTTTGSLNTARYAQTETALPDGQVLVAGGFDSSGNYLTNSEIFNPATGTWTVTGGLNQGRADAIATLLTNGLVLVEGGLGAGDEVLISAELYNPATGTWTLTGNLNAPRFGQTATLLTNGLVFVVGGDYIGWPGVPNAELYNPATGSWTLTGAPSLPLFDPTATLLPNGQVLVAGGNNESNDVVVANAELYNPVTGTWRTTGSMTTSRESATATLLPDGQVLVTGGADASFDTLASAELYNPATGTWRATGTMSAERFLHTATLLANGRVLVAGGTPGDGVLGSAESYDPTTGLWTLTSSLNTARMWHSAALLPNGRVLLAGGLDSANYPLASAELYNYEVPGSWINTASLSNAVYSQTATLLTNGQVLVAGGWDSGTVSVQATAQLYSPAAGTWTLTSSMNSARENMTATRLTNDLVLVTGGEGSFALLATAELYHPATGTWTLTGSLHTARRGHTATLLTNGLVLVAGGTIPGAFNPDTAAAELYNPATGTWTVTGSMHYARTGHTATLLPNGQVLVTQGASTNTAELFNPATGTWTVTGSMNQPRSAATVTLLPNGLVLAAGGEDYGYGEFGLAGAELYHPTTGKWTMTGYLNEARQYASAVLLTDGQVLVSGGYNWTTNDSTWSFLTSSELYNPTTGTWTVTGTMNFSGIYNTSTVLSNGPVLVVGGYNSSGASISNAQLYLPPARITTYAGEFSLAGTYSGDGGAATSAGLSSPAGVAVDGAGNLYIADAANNVIRKVTAGGTITTVAGNNSLGGGYSGDGGPATGAALNDPMAVTVDSAGNLYIADTANNVIRKVNTGGTITTVAGNYSLGGGYSGDGGPATSAALYAPVTVTVDGAGNLYIADTANNVIRQVNTSGTITTFAGDYSLGGTYSGDGGAATAAALNQPTGIALDSATNLYIADTGNNVIRVVNAASGNISTFAGNYSLGGTYSGDGGAATAAGLNQPIDVVVDGLGNLYISDDSNDVIRQVNAGGNIITFAGDYNNWGYSGDGGLAINAGLNYPWGVAVDVYGRLFVSDSGNGVVRRVAAY